MLLSNFDKRNHYYLIIVYKSIMVLYKHSLLTTIFSITIAIIIIVILNRYITYGNTNHESFSNLNILNYHIVENWNTYENYIADELIETNIVNIINRAVSKEGIVFALNLIKENVDDNIDEEVTRDIIKQNENLAVTVT